MEILRKGKNEKTESEETIFEILNKAKDGNLINFAKYVDLLISQDEINTYLIQRLSDSKNDIKYIYNCLGKYIEYEKLFELEFKREKRNSLFEYSIISCVIIEREDIYKFEQNRQFCPNRVNRILFHGTSLNAISKILPDMFYRAESNQNGNGVYFTNQLDSCWIYGSEERNNNPDPILGRRNLNIPKVGQFFSFIASAIYYDKNGFIPVLGRGYDPKKNQVNFAVAEMTELKTVDYRKTDKRRFYGTEFVINDLDQICPFLGFKLKRDEYCIIWRDNNFSKDPIHNNQFDNIFKKHLLELYDRINQKSKINIYTCQNSDEALKLVNLKKYNKIILISNIGTDLSGKKFIDESRKIIGNEVLVLFLAYNIAHLKWVKDYKNALFSNEPNFFEEYLKCFSDEYGDRKSNILDLKEEIEKNYNKFLYFPNYKNEGNYSDLIF